MLMSLQVARALLQIFQPLFNEVVLSSRIVALGEELAEERADALDDGRGGLWGFRRGLLLLRGPWFRSFWWRGRRCIC